MWQGRPEDDSSQLSMDSGSGGIMICWRICSYDVVKELEASGMDDAGGCSVRQRTPSLEIRAHQGTRSIRYTHHWSGVVMWGPCYSSVKDNCMVEWTLVKVVIWLLSNTGMPSVPTERGRASPCIYLCRVDGCKCCGYSRLNNFNIVSSHGHHNARQKGRVGSLDP